MPTQHNNTHTTAWQCVIFINGNTTALQSDINAWLLQNTLYKVRQVLQSESQSFLTVTIFYTLNNH